MKFDFLAAGVNICNLLLDIFNVPLPNPTTIISLLQDIESIPALNNMIGDLVSVADSKLGRRDAAKAIVLDFLSLAQSVTSENSIVQAVARAGFKVSLTTVRAALTGFSLYDASSILLQEVILGATTKGDPIVVRFSSEPAPVKT